MPYFKNGSKIGVNHVPNVSSGSGMYDLSSVHQYNIGTSFPTLQGIQLLASRQVTTAQNTYDNLTYSINGTAIAGKTGRFVVHCYGTTTFTSDVQIDDVDIPYSGTSTHDFETTAEGYERSSTVTGNTNIQTYFNVSFVGVSTGISGAGNWLRDSGGTTSSNTGSTIDQTLGTTAGFYLYMESSGTHPISNFLRSPEFTLESTGTISWYESAFGADLVNTTRDYYWLYDV